MSYEHCTVHEPNKEIVEKKDPTLKCRICNAGALKEAPSKISISNNVMLKWNNCKNTLKCFEDHEKFGITKNACKECGSAEVRVHYAVKESPFPFYANQHAGCIYCDEFLRKLVEFPENATPGPQVEAKEENKVEEPKIKKDNDSDDVPKIIVSKKKKRRR